MVQSWMDGRFDEFRILVIAIVFFFFFFARRSSKSKNRACWHQKIYNYYAVSMTYIWPCKKGHFLIQFKVV